MVDTVAPKITGDSLPLEGSTTSGIVDRFTLSFSKDMNASTINTTANYDLRAAGPDGVFGTADDVLYTIASPSYSSGLTSGLYRVSDGPLQPGRYQLTVGTGLTDKSGNHLVNPYVRTFMLASVAPFVLENRSNNTFATATSLSLAPGKHQIVVKKTGYLDWSRSMMVGSGVVRLSAEMVTVK